MSPVFLALTHEHMSHTIHLREDGVTDLTINYVLQGFSYVKIPTFTCMSILHNMPDLRWSPEMLNPLDVSSKYFIAESS